MGFTVPSPTLALTFDKYPGLEVRAGSIPLGQLLEMDDAATALRTGQGGSIQGRMLFEEFARNLRGWNCEYSPGMPVPADLDGLLSLDANFASEILLAWFDSISGSDLDKGPLGQPSTSGQPSVEPFVPTELL